MRLQTIARTLVFIACLTLLMGCLPLDAPAPTSCCTYQSVEFTVPVADLNPVPPPIVSTPIPARVYQVGEDWESQTLGSSDYAILQSRAGEATPIPGLTIYAVQPGRCRLQFPSQGESVGTQRVELNIGEAVLVAGGVLVCTNATLYGTSVALADVEILTDAVSTFR